MAGKRRPNEREGTPRSKPKHAGGRPRKYDTPEQMQVAIDAYFDEPKPHTVCGLALHLGFAQRKSLLDYEGYDAEFCNAIKRAILRVEGEYEEMACTKPNAAGPIFILKNMGWSDRQEIEHRSIGAFLQFLAERAGDRHNYTDAKPVESVEISGRAPCLPGVENSEGMPAISIPAVETAHPR